MWEDLQLWLTSPNDCGSFQIPVICGSIHERFSFMGFSHSTPFPCHLPDAHPQSHSGSAAHTLDFTIAVLSWVVSIAKGSSISPGSLQAYFQKYFLSHVTLMLWCHSRLHYVFPSISLEFNLILWSTLHGDM